MSSQDEKLDEELYGNVEPVGNDSDASESQVTADGYDYWVLMSHFCDLIDQDGMQQPQPGFFIAPGYSCTTSVH